MSGFVKRTRTVDTFNPAGGVNPASTPNVGQYGWTSFDAGNVNQIIEYVDLCKKYADVAGQSAEFIEGKIVELQDFMQYIEKVYEDIKPIYDNILPLYEDIEIRHEDIKIRHEDIIAKHSEVEDWHYEVNTLAEETEANAAKALTSQLLAGQSEQGAEEWYDKSYELYEDLRKGNIYRGTWNPHTGAYPDNGGTNSTWDVILNEGETEFRWNNILWFWGDRLVYLKEENKYQQIESGTTVISVNGKKGAVVLSAEDVKAVPVTRTVNGKALSANISITSTDTNSVPTTRRVNNKVLDSDIVLIHSDVQAVPLDRKINNKLLSADVTLSAGDVKALPITGGTLTGSLMLNQSSGYGHRLIASAEYAFYQGGKVDGDTTDQKLAFSGYGGKGLTSARIWMANKVSPTVRWGNTDYKIYHEGYKPTAADVDALPITGGTLTGSTFVDRGTGSEPQIGVKRDGRTLFMADNSTAQGMYSTAIPGKDPSWLVARNIGTGDITLGDNRSKTNINGSDATFTYKGNQVFHKNFKPTTADVTGLDEALKNSGGNPVLSTAWIQLRTAMWNGYVAADGQLLKRTDYPDAWAAIEAGKVPVTTDAIWLASDSNRGGFSTGDGSTTFRLPDYNGKSAGSLGAVFLRGDGLNSAGTNGVIQNDAIRNITGLVDANYTSSNISSGSSVIANGAMTFRPSQTSNKYAYTSGPYYGTKIDFDASRVVPTAADNHPVNVTGCWAIKLFGAVQNAGEIDAAALATQLAEAQSKIAEAQSKIAALESRRITQVVDVLWEGSETYAGALLRLSQPLVAGDMLTVEHSDGAKLITAVVTLVPNKMVAEQVLYFPFSAGGATSLKYVDENTLKTDIFTTGYAISKVYRTRYALV